MRSPPPSPDESIAAEAARWLARRDRRLTSAEQDEYLAWLRADPRHGQAFKIEQDTLARLMRLNEWQPGYSREPNPDLFAPAPVASVAFRQRNSVGVARAFGLAAALFLAALLSLPSAFQTSTEGSGPLALASPAGQAEGVSPFLIRTERVALEDGTVIELKAGSRLTTAYTRGERRVRLEDGGEGYFTVARDPQRPFVVEAAGIEAVALGTVFNVRVDAASVDVLVTEGRVRVATPPPSPAAPTPVAVETILQAGQRAKVMLDVEGPRSGAEVVAVTDDEIRSALQWQVPQLSFENTPLAVAVAEFNRHNAQRIIVDASPLRETRIGGAFRVDNVEGFIRSLELTLEAQAVRRGDGAIVLRPLGRAAP